MHPYSSSNDYHFREGCDSGRLTRMPVEQRDMGDWKGFEWAYLPREHQGIAKDSLVLDVGGEEGDTAVFFFEHGYTNLRVVEAYPGYFENLTHNVEILRSLGCKVDLRLETFKPEHLDGVKFIKIDCEGCEWVINLVNCGIPWGGELHMKGAPLRPESQANDYYCSIGLFRGDGQSHFRQLEAHNMQRHNWTYFDEDDSAFVDIPRF
jgi:hypothetical protein